MKLGNLPEGYDHKYTYSHIGYNLKITDWQAAIALAQLSKLDRFLEMRRQNAETLLHELDDLQQYLILPRITPNCTPSWFGFLISVKEDAPFSKQEMVTYLEANGIGTRQLFAGNILRQPMIAESDVKLRIGSSPIMEAKRLDESCYARLPGTEFIMNNTFWVGVAQNNTPEDMKRTSQVIHQFIRIKTNA